MSNRTIKSRIILGFRWPCSCVMVKVYLIFTWKLYILVGKSSSHNSWQEYQICSSEGTYHSWNIVILGPSLIMRCSFFVPINVLTFICCSIRELMEKLQIFKNPKHKYNYVTDNGWPKRFIVNIMFARKWKKMLVS